MRIKADEHKGRKREERSTAGERILRARPYGHQKKEKVGRRDHGRLMKAQRRTMACARPPEVKTLNIPINRIISV
jgi:hypothetical protein